MAETRHAPRHVASGHETPYLTRGRLALISAALAVAVTGPFLVAGVANAEPANPPASSSTVTPSHDLRPHTALITDAMQQISQTALASAAATERSAQGKVDTTVLAAAVEQLRDYTAHDTLGTQLRISALQGATRATAADVAAYDQRAAQQAAQAAAAQAAAQAAAAAAQQALAAANTPDGARATAQALAAGRGWGADQFQCLNSLWTRESNWNYQAYNPSGATGIPQALPGSKMASAGSDWQTDAATQITWGLGYIAGTYGTPCSAWAHSESSGWY